jgi:hypothetical protein
MSRRTRILLGILVVYVGAVVFLLYRVSLDIDPRYRESAEESLVDTANLLATLLERQAYGGVIQTEELERTRNNSPSFAPARSSRSRRPRRLHVCNRRPASCCSTRPGATSARTTAAGATSA